MMLLIKNYYLKLSSYEIFIRDNSDLRIIIIISSRSYVHIHRHKD